MTIASLRAKGFVLTVLAIAVLLFVGEPMARPFAWTALAIGLVAMWGGATTGTRSVLLGAHCFFLHPWFVAWGWFQLYGFKPIYIGAEPGYPQSVKWKLGFRGGPRFARLTSPVLWLAFIVHDIGYLGKPNMDDEEGEQHPRVGAAIMGALFGKKWSDFTLYHSRFLAKQSKARPSALCFADKMALSLIPWWLYLPMVQFTGEAAGYSFHKRRDRATTKYNGDPFTEEENRLASSDRMRDRVRAMQMYTRRWVAEHRDGRAGTWTPAQGVPT